jgi:aminoglycoside/choline kinase family phosphotransferase
MLLRSEQTITIKNCLLSTSVFSPLTTKFMQKAIEVIEQLVVAQFGNKAVRIEPLPQSGSDRQYFRITTDTDTFIGTFGLNVKENETFIYFTKLFNKKGLPVPSVICKNEEGTAYLQSDLGNVSLLNKLEEHGYSEPVKNLFKESLRQLAHLQVKGHDGINYTQCLTAREFGKQAIVSDLLYFKYYFLDTLKAPYDKQAMLDDFDALASYLTHTEYKFFMFRDFQSRNVMIVNGLPYFIDYQGGMKGAPQYDVASMLWQARANLPDEWKQDLLEDYMDSLDELLNKKIERSIFVGQYYGYVLIRMLQVLGAYGFRGLFERKAQFLTSIPQGLRNLKWFIENKPLGIHVPEFMRMLQHCVGNEVIEQFEPVVANEHTPLTVYVNSFSYLKNGYPADESGNGGGFVFDCRGVLNPGRIDRYKTQSGKDKDVIDYLEQNTKMPVFLNSVFDIIDINVEDYINRGFASLMINFGCTGGQHRSVYSAEQTARHLRNKYKVKTEVKHLNQENWKKVL